MPKKATKITKKAKKRPSTAGNGSNRRPGGSPATGNPIDVVAASKAIFRSHFLRKSR